MPRPAKHAAQAEALPGDHILCQSSEIVSRGGGLCWGRHHWARTLQALEHEVKLLPAKLVRPLVLRDKTDARDTQAIWVAAQQPQIKAVPVKNEQQ